MPCILSPRVQPYFCPADDAFLALLKALDITAEELLSQKELVTAVLQVGRGGAAQGRAGAA